MDPVFPMASSPGGNLLSVGDDMNFGDQEGSEVPGFQFLAEGRQKKRLGDHTSTVPSNVEFVVTESWHWTDGLSSGLPAPHMKRRSNSTTDAEGIRSTSPSWTESKIIRMQSGIPSQQVSPRTRQWAGSTYDFGNSSRDIPCKFEFQPGGCRKGSDCLYRHTLGATASSGERGGAAASSGERGGPPARGGSRTPPLGARRPSYRPPREEGDGLLASSADASSDGMAEASSGSPQAKPHKRRRLVVLAHLVSACCYFAGLVVLLLLPVLAKSTYVSENALMPGSAEASFERPNALDASTLADEVKSLAAKSIDASMAIQKWLVSNLEALGADSYLHPFIPSVNPFDAARFISTSPPENVSREYQWETASGGMEVNGRTAINVAGILRAPRGEGHDAIVLVTPFNIENVELGDALALGLGMEVFRLFSKAVWLAKDIIWLVADSRYDTYAAISAWLKEFYEPVLNSRPLGNFSVSGDVCERERPIGIKARYGISSSSVEGSYGCWKNSDDVLLRDLKRAGNIAAGFVLELQQGPEGVDYLQVQGQGLNLDLVNVCNNIATGWPQGFHMVLSSAPMVANSALVRGIGNLMETVGRELHKLNPKWGYHVLATDYVNGLATLVTSMLNQASGVPTGAHGAFRDYQVDAVTLHLFLGGKMGNKKTRVDTLENLGRLLELVVRSVNNLLEKLHHSPFLYVNLYMVPVLLLLVSIFLAAASQLLSSSTDAAVVQSTGVLESAQNESKEVVEGSQHNGSYGQSVQPLSIALIIYLWSVLVAVLPPLINFSLTFSSVRSLIAFYKYSESDEELKGVIWTSLATLSLLFFLVLIAVVNKRCSYSGSRTAMEDRCWRILKGFLLGSATIGLVVISVLNYAVALVGAITLVPMCMTACPVRRTWERIRSRGSRWGCIIFLILSNMMTILASPFCLVAVSNALFGYPADVNTGVLWRVIEFLWSWGSGLYHYALLVHLPCTVLSLYILFMPGS